VRLEIGEEPVMVRADAFSLEEAARNLLVNGLKHGQPPVTVGADLRGDSAVLWVRDSGPGPDPVIASRLGDRFVRSAGSKETSTGLGLSIVKAVAEAFGGSVEMKPCEGGFEAALLLPAAADGENE
jgi:two-component system sensor histidine kinase TctE